MAPVNVLLANTWSEKIDPTGWWMSEKANAILYVNISWMEFERTGMERISIHAKEITSSHPNGSSSLKF